METKESDVTQTIIAIYALHMKELGDFYKLALNLEEIESGDDYVCLGRSGIEVNILNVYLNRNTLSKPRIYCNLYSLHASESCTRFNLTRKVQVNCVGKRRCWHCF